MIQQILFGIILVLAIGFFTRKIRCVRRNILLGREVQLYGSAGQRRRNILLLAFGQKKMFRNPLVALMHFVIYAGFIIINIEILEIVLDGMAGTHRLFAAPLGGLYQFLINAFEWLAVGVIFVCVVFLFRRNVVRVTRLAGTDLDGWPRSDANYILISEIILMLLFLTLNASDTVLQERGVTHYAGYLTGNFNISKMIHPPLQGMSNDALILLERCCWWLHIVGILAFLNYLPWSKHLHILLAFPNAYYARQEPEGKMQNMPEIQKEVLHAMQPEQAPSPVENENPGRFGAKDIFDLSWRNLLDAYSCTECGRCSASCPANLTGKKLSPRKIMMATRDRLEEVGKNIDTNKQFKEDGRTLLHDYISEEELRACTTCNACVEECPVSISPLEIILQLRRYLIMEASSAPPEWNMMFSNTENNFAPWKFSPDDRDQWIRES